MTMAPPTEAMPEPTPVVEPVIEVMPEVKMEGEIASIEPMAEATV